MSNRSQWSANDKDSCDEEPRDQETINAGFGSGGRAGDRPADHNAADLACGLGSSLIYSSVGDNEY